MFKVMITSKEIYEWDAKEGEKGYVGQYDLNLECEIYKDKITLDDIVHVISKLLYVDNISKDDLHSEGDWIYYSQVEDGGAMEIKPTENGYFVTYEIRVVDEAIFDTSKLFE